MTELKPCPWCGGEMTLHGSSRLRRFTINHKAKNPDCPFFAFEIDWKTAGSLAEATEKWNRRVTDDD